MIWLTFSLWGNFVKDISNMKTCIWKKFKVWGIILADAITTFIYLSYMKIKDATNVKRKKNYERDWE